MPLMELQLASEIQADICCDLKVKKSHPKVAFVLLVGRARFELATNGPKDVKLAQTGGL